ncbi:MAG TPA: YceI family protein [Longimicrobiales bacterium]|nr:YceI family protein [Longimicrobiales bacterium]
MRARTMAALALLAFGAGAEVLAQDPPGTASRLTINGGSTLRSWSCSTANVQGRVSGQGSSIAELAAGTHQVALTIPVASIDCRNGTMNGHLRRALRAQRQPEIRFELDSYEVDAAGQVQAEGQLSVGGRTTPVRLSATVVPAPAGLRASGRVALRMTELGVEPPSLMLGTLKVHDRITIEFDVYLAQGQLVAAR